jgi:carbon-monoxide dehydrogenase large subunit
MADRSEDPQGPQALSRPEESRMVRGRGRFLDDIKLPEMCYAAFLRSPYAHAYIQKIDAGEALKIPGAIAVLAPEEVLPYVDPVRPATPGVSDYARPYDRYPLPPGKVVFSGEPVMAVAAECPYIAEDMVEAITVEYQPLPVLTDVEQSLAPGAPTIHQGMSDNILFYREFGGGDTERAFRQADLVLEKTFRFPRQTAVPLEGRGAIASFDRGQDRLTIWTSCQSPHRAKTVFSTVLRLPEHSVRVISPDMGGDFGIKGIGYPEAIALAFLSKKIGRPVKWVEDRMENLRACAHAHEQKVQVSVAARRDGTVLAVRSKVLVDQGAHCLGPIGAGLEPMTTGQSIVGPYCIENYSCQAYAVLTNKCPGGAYRGVGTVQGVFVIERIMDMVAHALRLDPAEVRRRNFIQPHQLPYNTAAGRLYDSGDYAGALDKLLELANYHSLRREQEKARARGEYLGIGIACFVEHTSTGSQDYRKRGVVGIPGFDSATVRVDARGNVQVGVSARSTGQGHESVFASLVARELGVPYETVRVLEGDTDATPFGTGTGVSRSAVSTGGAIRLAVQDIRRKAFEIARFFLKTEEEELEMANGEVFIKGDPPRRVPFASVAAAAYNGSREVVLPENMERGLESTRSFDPPHQVFGNGAHLAVVQVDPETGLVKLKKYFIVEDCGTILDHVVVDGQVVGGAALGMGNALFEELKYDEGGQLLTGSLMDYLVPTPRDIPECRVLHTETPSPFTPGGVKGVGEAGTVGAYTAVANAVADALLPLGVELTEPPVGPQRVWALIKTSQTRPELVERESGG